jgi:hypothetical protein
MVQTWVSCLIGSSYYDHWNQAGLSGPQMFCSSSIVSCISYAELFHDQWSLGGFQLHEFSYLTLLTRHANATLSWLNLPVCLQLLRSGDPPYSWQVTHFVTLNLQGSNVSYVTREPAYRERGYSKVYHAKHFIEARLKARKQSLCRASKADLTLQNFSCHFCYRLSLVFMIGHVPPVP